MTVFRYRGWTLLLPVAFIAIALIATPGSQSKKARNWKAIAWGVILVAMGLQMMAEIVTDRAVIESEQFRLSVGLWPFRSDCEVAFADLDKVEVVKERGGEGSNLWIDLDCYLRSGKKHRMNANGRLAQKALNRILEACRARGILAIDMRPLPEPVHK